MSEEPLATVIICTRDRSQSLKGTLTSIVTAARKVSDKWELLVVNNGSTDATKSVLLEFADQLPLNEVFEPEAGLSNARNAGVRQSSGKFILWTDDDVLVDDNWLSVYFQAFKDFPEHAIFGGRTTPIYEGPVRAWFKANENELCSLLAIRDDLSWTEIRNDRVPYGLNYAIRGREQRSNLYNPNLGVAPGRRGGGEEVTVIRTLLASGFSGVWLWNATVYHLIPALRQSESYIRKFYSAHGYDHPVAGHRVGLISRAKGTVLALNMWVKSVVALAVKRRTNRAKSVRHLIRASQAKASLRRYLGLRA